MSDTTLENSKAENDLGVVSVNINWNKHHNVILGKSSQKFGLLRRACFLVRLNKVGKYCS